MASRGKNPGWRDRSAVGLLLRNFPNLGDEGAVLIAGDPLLEAPSELKRRGMEVATWDRRAFGGRVATPWPVGGPFRGVALRLPRSKAELSMSLAAAAVVLPSGGVLLVYGAKDEGVGSAPPQMEEFFQDVHTLAVGGRCRVLMGTRKEVIPEVKSEFLEWRESHPLDVPGLPDSWVSYPGVFAQGHLDPGTKLLLEALSEMEPGARTLDYGCGSGVVGASVLQSSPGVEVHLLDVDSVALEAARENVPQATPILGDGLSAVGPRRYEAIITNPPFHRGKGEDPGMINALILESPSVLTPHGRLVLVAQKRLTLGPAFRAAFKNVSSLAQGFGFRVWEGIQPKNPGAPPVGPAPK